jgi:hypothetical protein
VTFYNGVTQIGTGTVNNSVATLAISTLPLGPNSLTAIYSGDSNYVGSTSAAINQTVNQAGVGITVGSSENPSNYGDPVTFTATINADYGLLKHSNLKAKPQDVTGTVVWSDSEGLLTCGTTTVSYTPGTGTGTATCTTSALTAGADTITATYSGDGNHNGGTGTLSQAINQAGSTVTVASSANPSSYGQAVSFTATVTAGATGTVQFYIDGGLFDTETLSSSMATSVSIATLAAGTPHIVSVNYAGDNNFPANQGLLQGGQIVNAAGVTVGIVSNPSPSSWNQSVTFTATITSDTGLVKGRKGASRNGVKPKDVTGSVQWSDNTGCGTTAVSYTSGTGTGTATCTTSSLSVGSDTITATYQGDSNHATGTGTLSQVVNQASTTTGLVSISNPSTYQQNVTFTATITPANGGSVTGTVTFYNGTSQIGTGTVNNNTATLALSTLPIGSDSITATYSGDTNYLSSTSLPVNQTVNKLGTTTGLVVNPYQSTYSQVVTFAAAITPADGGSATGTVTFYNGASQLGIATVSGNAATLSTSTLPAGVLPAGTDVITAVYGGDATYKPSTSPSVNEPVSQASTLVSLTSSLPQSAYGQSVTFGVKVYFSNPSGFTSTGNIMTGTVTLYNGSNVIGTAAVSGIGTFQTPFTTNMLPAGTNSIRAVYSGDANNRGASQPLTEVVNQATTTTTLSVSPTQTYVGGDVTFTATVAPQYVGTPTGTVFFYDGKTRYPAQLSGGVATYTTASLKAGSHSIRAVYSSDSNFKSSTSSAVSLTITAENATTTSLTSSAGTTTLYIGQSVTFTATVTATSGSPDGTVTFEDGSTVLQAVPVSNGVAQYSTSVLAAGNHHIVALYSSASGEFKPSTASLTQKVALYPDSMTLTSSQNGQSVALFATLTSTNGGGTPNDGTVTFSDTLNRTTTVLSCSPVPVTQGNAQCTEQLAAGTHRITAKYTGSAKFANALAAALTVKVQ